MADSIKKKKINELDNTVIANGGDLLLISQQDKTRNIKLETLSGYIVNAYGFGALATKNYITQDDLSGALNIAQIEDLPELITKFNTLSNELGDLAYKSKINTSEITSLTEYDSELTSNAEIQCSDTMNGALQKLQGQITHNTEQITTLGGNIQQNRSNITSLTTQVNAQREDINSKISSVVVTPNKNIQSQTLLATITVDGKSENIYGSIAADTSGGLINGETLKVSTKNNLRVRDYRKTSAPLIYTVQNDCALFIDVNWTGNDKDLSFYFDSARTKPLFLLCDLWGSPDTGHHSQIFPLTKNTKLYLYSTSDASDAFNLTFIEYKLFDIRSINSTDVYLVESKRGTGATSDLTWWYRQYSDGWCEAGGNNIITGGESVVVLPKKYSTAMYNVNLNLLTANNSTQYQLQCGSRSESSFNIYSTNTTEMKFMWETKGYIR